MRELRSAVSVEMYGVSSVPGPREAGKPQGGRSSGWPLCVMLAITGLVGQLKIVLGGTAVPHTYRVWGAALTWLSGYPNSRNAVSF
jgi:hypothetical protein